MSGGHFKLGLFVTIAVTLLVVFLLVLGVLDRFRPRVQIETYFSEIQTLQPRAPVRFRGVAVGTVDWIGFAASRYTEAPGSHLAGSKQGYVMVEMSLFADALRRAGVNDVRPDLEEAIDVGLRARISQTGLGGPAFVSLDYVDPNQFPAPDLPWEPEHISIPPAPSTIVSIIDSFASILRELDESNALEEVGLIGDALGRLVNELEDSGLLEETGGALGELRAASAEVRALLTDPRLDALLDDTGATMEGARALFEGDFDEIETLVGDMTSMAATLDRAGSSLESLATTVNESDLIDRLQTLANELGPAGRDLSSLADRLNRLVTSNEQEIADTIRSLRDAALELEAMLEEIKANPSRILADPPPRRTPGGGP